MRGLVPFMLVGLAWVLPAPAAAHHGHVEEAPWRACLHHSLDDACAWSAGDHLVARGTCRGVGGGLLCVRHRPLERQPVAMDSGVAWGASALGLMVTALALLGGVVAGLWRLRHARAH